MNANGNSQRLVKRIRTRIGALAPETLLVSLFVVLFVVSTGFLSWKIARDLDPGYDKNYWIAAFEKRDGRSLEFFIENYSTATEFSYTVSGGRKTITTGAVPVPRGERRLVDFADPGVSGRITVTIEDGQGGKKSLYLER